MSAWRTKDARAPVLRMPDYSGDRNFCSINLFGAQLALHRPLHQAANEVSPRSPFHVPPVCVAHSFFIKKKKKKIFLHRFQACVHVARYYHAVPCAPRLLMINWKLWPALFKGHPVVDFVPLFLRLGQVTILQVNFFFFLNN